MSVKQADVTPSSAADSPADAGAAWHTPAKPRQISLRSSLIMLVLACVLPGVALCSYLLYANYQLEKKRMVEQTELLASQILVELDRELAVIESGLHVLATSEHLQSGNLQHFHKIASAALESQTVYNYVLTDRQGRQVLNTLRPFGKGLPQSGSPPQLAEVFAAGKTVLSDLFQGPLTGKPIVAMGVPVYGKNGEVIYSLNVGMLPTQLNALLQRQSFQHGWLAAIVDSSGTIIGRSRDAERFVGQKAVAELRTVLQTTHHGSLSTLTKEGIPVATAYARSPLWKWSVVTGAPKSLIETEMFRMFAGLGAAALLLIVMGSWLALCITQRVLSSVNYLNDAALALRNGKPIAPPKVQLHEAEAVGHAIVQASHLMAKVHHRAYHDPLTELGNRALFYELVQHQLAVAEREGGKLGILAIDLDHFKVVNDEEGHAAGDQLLAAVARRLEATIRAADAAARMGGDEFSILLVDADQASATEMANRLVSELAKPYPGIQTRVSASIGIAVYPEAGTDLAELLENADRALYAAKRGGRNTCCLAGCTQANEI